MLEYASCEKKKQNKGGKKGPSLLKKKPYILGNNATYMFSYKNP